MKKTCLIIRIEEKIIDIACDFAEGGMQYFHYNFFEDYMQGWPTTPTGKTGYRVQLGVDC